MAFFRPAKTPELRAPLSADDVLNKKFTATKFREGYDQDGVDDLLDQVVRTLRRSTAHPLTGDDVRGATFQATKFREGYDQDEVDDFLDLVVLTLEGRRS